MFDSSNASKFGQLDELYRQDPSTHVKAWHINHRLNRISINLLLVDQNNGLQKHESLTTSAFACDSDGNWIAPRVHALSTLMCQNVYLLWSEWGKHPLIPKVINCCWKRVKDRQKLSDTILRLAGYRVVTTTMHSYTVSSHAYPLPCSCRGLDAGDEAKTPPCMSSDFCWSPLTLQNLMSRVKTQNKDWKAGACSGVIRCSVELWHLPASGELNTKAMVQ